MRLSFKNKILIILLAVVTLIICILFIYINHTYGAKMAVNYKVIAANEDYDVNIVRQENEVTELAKESKADFKILAFTDMHLDGVDQKAMDLTMDEFQNAMNLEKPDLVIFTGDIVTAILNKERAEKLADMMEAYGVYWCAILGNHEGEHPLAFSRRDIIKLWADDNKYPHCLVESGPEDIYGYGNYVVNLLSEDHILQSLIFMDCGAKVSKEDAKKYHINEASYDFIKENQINWYKKVVSELPQGSKSSLFIHIPLCEYATGLAAIYDMESLTITDTDDCKYISGTQREPVCCSEYNSGLFDVMLSLGSTKTVFCGHDHINDCSISYKGIDLNYLQASGYTTSTYGWNDETGAISNIVEEESLQGYSVINVKDDGGYQLTRIKYKK